jgi:tRNA(Ile)-lysidine synthase
LRAPGAVDTVTEAVRASGVLAPDRALVAMLSGGRDSVCLLDVAVALRGGDAVRALHVNYGLRAGADGDERHCRALCASLGVPLEVRSATRDEHGAAGNLQAWAREVRYEAARELARADDALIATGHTASDQVETILYRLAASPGRRALLGMRASERGIVRPLLGVTRAQTAAYCEERGLSWREDESNADPGYARARVRNDVVPALASVHPAAEANVLRTAELLRAEADLLDELVEDELGGRAMVSLARLRELPESLARLLVVRLAENAAGTYVPQAGSRVAEILALGERGGRAELHLGGLASAVVQGGMLEIVRLAPRGGADERGADL